MGYFLPNSLTWLAGATLIALGVFLGFEPVHEMSNYAQSVRNVVGDVSPAALVLNGVGFIGIRAKLERSA